MSDKRILIINIPVIHRGFLDFLKKNKKNISVIYLVGEVIAKKFSGLHNDIASIDTKESKIILKALGFNNVDIFDKSAVKRLENKKLLLVNDKLSREIVNNFFPGADIKWSSIFLRWDADSVLAEHSLSERKSTEKIDEKWMREAYLEAEKSGDWWRQVGAVIVRDGVIILRAYNESLPSDYTPYQVGNVRDYIKAGEKQELSSTIHSEQKLISEAAKKGIPLDGVSLYITHFPCPVCTKLILNSGIKKCFFSEGASNLSGEKLLKAAGIELLAVNLKK
jgi:dCMP deaminase